MYPDLFGVDNLSYTLCMVLGILLAFTIACLYLWKKGFKKNGIIDLLICACSAIVFGLVFAILFENLYEFIEYGTKHQWTWGMTFLGGLCGGVIGFLVPYFIMRKNVKFDIKPILIIAPLCIAAAHCIGRVGCFLAGCCYGKPTDSWIGVDFPNDGLGKVIPTQLIEAIFLLLLSIALAVIILVKEFKYTFLIYLGTYSIFRFIIEFYRGDERGVAFILSPSQVWCIIIFLGLFPLYLLLRKIFVTDNEKEQSH
jgi:phosphatidylglycerol:prolipoprotein diacylglycerol transferase